MAITDAESIALGKKQAAYAAIDEFIKNDMVVGIGSGSTVVFAVERLAHRVHTEKLSIRCIPTSFQAKQLICEHGLFLSDLERDPLIDVAIDGADEVDEDLNCIKGGGGCCTQEKIVAAQSKKFVVIADFTKNSSKLGEKWKKGVPIEVIPMAYSPILHRLKTMGATPKLRMAVAKAGPVVTDNGCFIIDADFGVISDPKKLESDLRGVVGIVENGLFINMACCAYIGNADGTVTKR